MQCSKTYGRSILEIGAGYCRTASVLLRLFPQASYTIIDIEPAISLSRWYLGQLFGPERLSFLKPVEVDQLPRSSANLPLSVSSLQEMTYAQVEDYLALLDHMVSGGTVYFKQRRRWHNAEDDLTLDFDHGPIPADWRQDFRQICPVQTSFIEAAWQV